MSEKKPKTYNTATHNPPRLNGWSNQGDNRQDGEAKMIHETWIRKAKKK